jgi:hypothetical protein
MPVMMKAYQGAPGSNMPPGGMDPNQFANNSGSNPTVEEVD